MRIAKSILPMLAALSAAGLYAAPAAAQNQTVLVLLDRSGSMFYEAQCMDGANAPKWECATAAAVNWINSNDAPGLRRYFVWQLTTMADDGIAIRSGDVDASMSKSEAIDYIQALPDLEADQGSTPLAGAYCDAIGFLQDYRTSVSDFSMELMIRLESDGEENATPDTNDCFSTLSSGDVDFVPAPPPGGPVFTPSVNPTQVDNLLLGSWESYMYDFALTGAAHEFPPLDAAAFIVPPLGRPVLANAYTDFIDAFDEIDPLAARAAARSATVGEDRARSAAMSRSSTFATTAAATAAPPGFIDFLAGMSERFNGRFTKFGSGTLPPAGDPWAFHEQPADVNDDGCVNTADYTFVQQLYGQRVSAAVPNTYRADVNLDGKVSSEDYFLLQQHYGEGCATPPAPLPVLGAALLGFDDASKWSSPQTAVTLNSILHTEGAFSLSVGGTGWREVNSVSFLSSSFGTVRAKLAFDVFVPAKPVNPYWLGQVMALISIPSAGINNLYLGAMELTGKPKGAFSTATVNLPQNVRTALGQNRNVTLRLIVNSNDTGHLLDKVRLVP